MKSLSASDRAVRILDNSGDFFYNLPIMLSRCACVMAVHLTRSHVSNPAPF